MRLKNLKLKDFRNFTDCEITLSDQTTIFYGGVGEGKTNIIEAMFLLSIGRSHRTSENIQLISWGKSEAYIRGEAENTNGDLNTAIKVSKTGKRIELNGENNKRSLELLGGIKSVMFHGEDVAVVGGAPHMRRRYLDLAISQVSKNYAYNLRDYYKVLKQRNAALARTGLSGMGEWDEQISGLGTWITQVRSSAVLEIMETSRNIIGALAGRETDLEIKYVPSGDDEAEKFSAKLSKARAMDVLKGSTSVGPHRDDVKITLNGVDARHYASSGEKKTIALAMKLAEVEFIKNMTGEKPIILLDDVFSTLDIKRSRALLGVTGDGSQCVITTPDLNALMDEIKKGVTLYEVSKGHARKAK